MLAERGDEVINCILANLANTYQSFSQWPIRALYPLPINKKVRIHCVNCPDLASQYNYQQSDPVEPIESISSYNFKSVPENLLLLIVHQDGTFPSNCEYSSLGNNSETTFCRFTWFRELLLPFMPNLERNVIFSAFTF